RTFTSKGKSEGPRCDHGDARSLSSRWYEVVEVGNPAARNAPTRRRATSASTVVPSNDPTMFTPPRRVVAATGRTRAVAVRVGRGDDGTGGDVALEVVGTRGVVRDEAVGASRSLSPSPTPSSAAPCDTSARADNRAGARRPISSSDPSLA